MTCFLQIPYSRTRWPSEKAKIFLYPEISSKDSFFSTCSLLFGARTRIIDNSNIIISISLGELTPKCLMTCFYKEICLFKLHFIESELKGVSLSPSPCQYFPAFLSILLSSFSSVNLEEILRYSHWDSNGNFTEGLLHPIQHVRVVKDFTYYIESYSKHIIVKFLETKDQRERTS